MGCSTKQSADILGLKIEQKEKPMINIAKSGDFLFYAYLEGGDKLTRISKTKVPQGEYEEIIRVYSYGYYPIYDIPSKSITCGKEIAKVNYTKKNLNFCTSYYTKVFSKTLSVLGNALLVTFTGTYVYFPDFDPELFKKSIEKSKLPQIKQLIEKHPIIMYYNNILSADYLFQKFKQIYEFDQEFNQINSTYNNEVVVSNITASNSQVMGNDVFKTIQHYVEDNLNRYFSVENINIPPKVVKPKLPPVAKLEKSQFETKKMFYHRVQLEMKKRENIINGLQRAYRKDVEERNSAIERVLETRKSRLANIDLKKEQLTKEAVQKYFNPYLANPRYDAENQLLYADLKIRGFRDYSRNLFFKVPLDKSRDIYDAIKTNLIQINVKLKVENSTITLKSVNINIFHQQLDKDLLYIATFTDKHYQPKKIEVAIKDKKVDFIADKLQNPNLEDKYKVVGISYGEASADGINAIANFQDDLPNLLSRVSTASKDHKKWLFVIGVEKYDNTDSVLFSKRSAELFVKVAQKTLGVTERNSYALIGNQATSGAIEDRLNRMLENVKKGDSIYFFYSGHGIPLLPNRTPYLLPKDKIPDYIGRSPFFKLTNIYNLLSNSKASKVIAVMDSCFSGSTDGHSVFIGVAGSVLVPKKVTFNHDKMVVLTAGREKQFSNMFPKKGHRLFSYFVMKSLLEGKRGVSDVYNYVYPKVKSVSNGFGDLKRQEPTIEGNEGLRF